MRTTSLCPWLPFIAGGESGLAGGRGVAGPDRPRRGPGLGLSQALRRWRLAGTVHHPGTTVLDLVMMLVQGGDCVADVATL